MKGCQGCTQCDFGNLCHRSFFCNASSLIAQTQIPDSVLQVQNCIRVSMSTNCILRATCNCQCHKPPNPQTPTRYWHRGTKICRVIKRAATGAGDWELGTGNLTSPGGKVEVGDGRWKWAGQRLIAPGSAMCIWMWMESQGRGHVQRFRGILKFYVAVPQFCWPN